LWHTVSSSVKLPPNYFEEFEAAHETPRCIRMVWNEPPHFPSGLAKHTSSTVKSNSFAALQVSKRVDWRHLRWYRQGCLHCLLPIGPLPRPTLHP
jgi:hypothetical protein